MKLRRIAAIALLSVLYGGAALLSRALYRRPRGWRRSGCILVIATFHNPNWFRAHVRPLVRSGIGELVLVCDQLVEPMNGVRYECPPRWMAMLFSRAGAKFLWALRCAARYRPDLYMGYHIFPAALSALVLSRVFHRPACYQVTAGPAELQGGGWGVENRVLAALQRPSALVETLVHRVVREFDSVVVRGSGAAAYLRRIGYAAQPAVITGSVEPAGGPWRDFAARSVDLAFVGRVADDKRPERFIAVVAAVVKSLPGVRAAVVGDGPRTPGLRALARELGIEANVQFLGQRSDVDELLAQTRVFVLTSQSEGVSIAMLEAMTAGAVPVVADVGDLGDFVRDELNGYLVAQDDIDGYARAALGVLSSKPLWRRLSSRARGRAAEVTATEAVAKRWRQHLRAVLAKRRATGDIASSSTPI
jgi:glycosyltransferase involved in cell wall biosynthesis